MSEIGREDRDADKRHNETKRNYHAESQAAAWKPLKANASQDQITRRTLQRNAKAINSKR